MTARLKYPLLLRPAARVVLLQRGEHLLVGQVVPPAPITSSRLSSVFSRSSAMYSSATIRALMLARRSVTDGPVASCRVVWPCKTNGRARRGVPCRATDCTQGDTFTRQPPSRGRWCVAVGQQALDLLDGQRLRVRQRGIVRDRRRTHLAAPCAASRSQPAGPCSGARQRDRASPAAAQPDNDRRVNPWSEFLTAAPSGKAKPMSEDG
jgi:hypothetical protein